MNRVKFNFRPEWKGPIEGWTVNFVNKNIWRCGPDYDMEDLVQDAFLTYMMVRDRYPEVRTPQHFMALFKRCFGNHVHALANKRTKRSEQHLDEEERQKLKRLKAPDGDIDEKMLRLSLESLARPVKKLIEEMGVLNPDIRTERVRSKQVLPNGSKVRETTNQFFCRLAGVDPADVDMVRMVEESLT
jgi:hypothetical protein